MNPQMVVSIGREALILMLMLSGPMLLFGLVVGVSIALFQAVTQIQEMTLTFVPKILAVALALLIFLPWMINMITDFTRNLYEMIPTLVG
ncbi:MAG: flagellar biosynthesis protein FliQ [candidate division Zixibacteria bacterium]|jgi:flagellar biosynthetic protein FliQ|nr:flagellar biosynthesis protein FliQ [candidate division Zixibacteria bacterium]MCK4606008.1 flagellar biosynthesis protein FliQ [candidate division Zixibacteria bacterium]